MIIDEDNEIVNGNIGRISAEDLLQFIKYAEKLDLPCLQFIELTGDTFFSNMQMHQIRNELNELKKHSVANHNIVSIIEKGINEGLIEDFQYLTFKGL